MTKNAVTILIAATMALGMASTRAQTRGEAPPKPGWEYTPEEFGVGRKHTPNKTCNAEIDKLLDEIRRCFNTRPASECAAVQERNSNREARIKKQRRCRPKPAR